MHHTTAQTVSSETKRHSVDSVVLLGDGFRSCIPGYIFSVRVNTCRLMNQDIIRAFARMPPGATSLHVSPGPISTVGLIVVQTRAKVRCMLRFYCSKNMRVSVHMLW